MRKTPDLSATLAKGAAEAKEILSQTAASLDTEWQRVMRTIDSSDAVPDQVKQQLNQAVARLTSVVESVKRESTSTAEEMAHDLVEAVGDVRTFVTNLASAVVRAAAHAGVPVPGASQVDQRKPTETVATVADSMVADGRVADGRVADDTIGCIAEDAVKDLTPAGPDPLVRPNRRAVTTDSGSGASKKAVRAATQKAVATTTQKAVKATKKATSQASSTSSAAARRAAAPKAVSRKAAAKRAGTPMPSTDQADCDS